MVLSEISTPPPIDITSIEINSKEKCQLRGSLLANIKKVVIILTLKNSVLNNKISTDYLK